MAGFAMLQGTLQRFVLKGILAAATALCCCRQAAALAPNLTLQQLEHTSWTIQSGVPSGINALTQTSDGWLWLGTTNGLYRFDGVKFELYQPLHGQKFSDTGIQTLYATREGGLWIGYLRGEASLLENGIIHNYSYRADKMPRGTVISFFEDQDESIWVAAAGGLGHRSNGSWHQVGTDMNFDSPEASFFCQDQAGTLWLTTTTSVYYLAKGVSAFVKIGFKGMDFAQCAQTRDGTVWIEDPFGLVPLTKTMPKSFPPAARLITVKDPAGLMVDRDGSLWEFPIHGGIQRLSSPTTVASLPPKTKLGSVQRFTHTDGLTSDTVTSFLEDHEGNIWIATARGLDRFRATTFTPAPIPASLRSFALAAAQDGAMMIGSEDGGLVQLHGTDLQVLGNVPRGSVTALYSAPDGKIWIGGVGLLGYLLGTRYVPLTISDDPDGPRQPTATQAITAGAAGDLWISIQGRGMTRIHNDEWLPDHTLVHKIGTAVTLMTDHGGKVWAGYMKNLVSVHAGNQVRLLDAKQGLNVGNVTALTEFETHVWVGGEHGLNLYKDGRFIKTSFAGSLTVEGITGIVFAGDRSLWLNASPGIFRIPADEIATFLNNPEHAVNAEAFNYLDGIPGDAGMLYPLPTAVKGADGKLWFATTGGLVFINPAHIMTNHAVPSVAISSVRADRATIAAERESQVPKGTRSLEIDYTALSFSIPERVRFKYKLEGFDTDWQDAGNRRQAFYTGLPPNHYVFRVVACNNDGIWNTTGASLLIILPATFLQGWYFKLLCFILGTTALWWLYHLRISQAELKIRTRLYERISERERIARDLHDTFFQGIQGLLLSFNLGTKRMAKEDPVRSLFEDTLSLSDQVMLEGRKLVLDLRTRSSEPAELASDLSAAAAEFAKLHPAKFELIVTGKEQQLDTMVSEEIYRIGREALYNAFRHAQAKNIETELIYASSEMRLNFRDDGVGIPEDVMQTGSIEGHFGLPGMAERANKIGAKFSIFSRSGGGTEIELKISSRLAYRSSETRGWRRS